MYDIEKTKDSCQLMAWIVWLAAVFFYFYELFVRVAPGAMLQEMQAYYGVNAGTFGMASGVYYYVYAPMQLVAGVMLDRLGGRVIMAWASIIVTIGCTIVLLPINSVVVFALARFFMGFGSAFGFIGVMYLATVWIHKGKLSLVSGLTTATGFIGAILALKVIPDFVFDIGWKTCWKRSACFGVLSTAILLLFVPKTPVWEQKRKEANFEEFSDKNFLTGFLEVIKNSQTWVLGIVGGLLYMPTTVFGDLWGKEFVESVCGVSDGGMATAMLYTGWLFGAPFWGFISDKSGLKKSLLIFSTISCPLLMTIMLLLDDISLDTIKILLFLTGFVSAPQVICFVASIEINPKYASGSAIAVVNMIVTFVGGLLQPAVGYILDMLSGNSDTHNYSSTDFRIAMAVMPIAVALGFFITLLIKLKRKHE
ncbi:MAG: MFS transporter [Puniceicoccales bacterium]|jgi:MFS family permease|nr:MFS transporter [Puniceicoccales bacterium]